MHRMFFPMPINIRTDKIININTPFFLLWMPKGATTFICNHCTATAVRVWAVGCKKEWSWQRQERETNPSNMSILPPSLTRYPLGIDGSIPASIRHICLWGYRDSPSSSLRGNREKMAEKAVLRQDKLQQAACFLRTLFFSCKMRIIIITQ